MFKQLGIQPSNFNAIIALITDLETKPSDKRNGYYIVSGLWGTCFHRIAKNKDRFEIVGNSNPRCPHTYTKIPASLADKTYFVYVNYRNGYVINLPIGAKVVGMSEAQPHRVGGWWSQSALVYSPTGEAPTVEETDTPTAPTELPCMAKEFFTVTVPRIMWGLPIRYIAVDEEGFVASNSTRPDRVPAPVPATQRIELPEIQL